MYLSPYVEEPLNSKVIKSFVPELRSRKCFSCYEIPMFYVYMLRIFHIRFTHNRIWLWYTGLRLPVRIGDRYPSNHTLIERKYTFLIFFFLNRGNYIINLDFLVMVIQIYNIISSI